MKSIPHSRQPFSESFKRQFNQLCRTFGEEPVFKQQEYPDVKIIISLTLIISTFLITLLYMLTTNYYL